MTDIPHDHLGQPDLQALVRQCGGFDKYSLRVGSLQRRMAGAPSCRNSKTPPTSNSPIERTRTTKAEVEAHRKALLDIIEGTGR